MKNHKNYEVNNVAPQMDKKQKNLILSSLPCNWWCIRDSRNISGCTGILFFIIIMIIFFCHVETKKDPLEEKEQHNESQHKPKLSLLKTSLHEDNYCSSSGSSIQCSNINEGAMLKVQEEINNFAVKIPDQITLTFINLLDTTTIMKQNWLQQVNTRINSLTIRDTFLPTINDKTFEGPPFVQMRNLNLVLKGNLNLNKESFSGLDGLFLLSIIGMKIAFAEPETLRPVSSTLSTLQLQASISNPQVIWNLTGGRKQFKLENLEILDLRNNKYRTLYANTFSKTPTIISLYLDYSTFVDSLDPETFIGIAPEQLTMTSSKLTTLPKGIFDPFRDGTTLVLTNNKWNCVCSFQWFQDLYKLSRMFQNKDLQCFSEGQDYDLYMFPFCSSPAPQTTTEATTMISFQTSTPFAYTTKIPTSEPKTSTEISTTSSTPDHWDHDKIPCFSANVTVSTSYESSPSRIIYLGSQNVRVEFRRIDGEAKYVVTIKEGLGNDMVFVLLNKNGWTLCLTDIQNTFVLEALEHGETYIVCILHASQHMVSPKNCQSLSVPKKWQDQSWIVNEFKIPVITGAVLGVIITILLSSIGMYVFVKRNPDVVYGRDNVILIENSSHKKSVKDLNYEEQRYTPSLMSMSDGYLSPRIYESPEDLHIQIPTLDPYYGAQHRTKIYPTLRRSEMLKDDASSRLSQHEAIYESVNVWLSPSASTYNANFGYSQNIYNSL